MHSQPSGLLTVWYSDESLSSMVLLVNVVFPVAVSLVASVGIEDNKLGYVYFL